jgi:hypothetical protein
MAINLSDNIQVNLGKPVDNKYLQPILNRPYTGVSEVNSTIVEPLRHTGLTVNINGVEYWYKDGITNGDLVLKTAGGGTGERIEKDITQASHGFVIGDVIGWDNGLGEYRTVISTSSETIEPVGMVSAVADASGFTVAFAGYVENISGITDANSNPIVGGTVYYLSDTISGKLTLTQPLTVGSISKPVLSTNTNDDGIVFQYRGALITSGFTGTTGGTVTTASGERIEKEFTQAAHGFGIGDVVIYSGGTYVKAIADGTQDGEVFGVVTEVPSSSGFTVTFAGYVTGLTSAGLSTNTTYFVSDTVAGQLSTTKPTTEGHIVKPILATTTVDEALVFQYLGVTVATGLTQSFITGGTNLGTGEGVLKTPVTGEELEFRTIKGSGNTNVFTVGDEIIIEVTGVTNNTIVASGTTYNATPDDRFISASGVSTVTLSGATIIGQVITISDIEGNAGASPITIDASPDNITDASTGIINTDYGSVTLVWNGYIWSVIAFYP